MKKNNVNKFNIAPKLSDLSITEKKSKISELPNMAYSKYLEKLVGNSPKTYMWKGIAKW